MCTGIRFSDNNGNMYFGRNLDWFEGYGQKVVITPRGYKYSSAFLGEMTPQFGAVIGMAIIAENAPLYFDCYNEAGIGVAGLNFPAYANYAPTAVEGKTNIAVYEFPLWVALNFSTVDEVENALKDVAIVAKPLSEQYPVSELHFMIGDKDRSIVVEYTKNGMEIFHNEVDVLTNQPGYQWHQENLRNYMNLSSERMAEAKWGKATLVPFGNGAMLRGIPGDYYPTSRFIRAAYLNTHYPIKDNENDNVLRLFHTLAGVAVIEGAVHVDASKFEKTIYTGGYSTGSKTYYYNTYDNPGVRRVSMMEHDLDSADLIGV